MKEIRKSFLRTKGTWHTVFIGKGKETVKLYCPDCGKAGDLGEHEIDADGKVTPSVVCPNEDCNFHEYIILKDKTI